MKDLDQHIDKHILEMKKLRSSIDDHLFMTTILELQHKEVRRLRHVVENLRKIHYGIEGAEEIDPNSGYPINNIE